jgi:apolipoprotein N-acyltransferase
VVALHQHALLWRHGGLARGARRARAGAAWRCTTLALALWARLRSRRAVPALRFAAVWLLAELARGVLFTGFPWVAAGYAHVDAPLAAWAASTASRRSRHGWPSR